MIIQTNQTSRRQDWVSFLARAIVLSLFFLIPCQPVNALDERIVFDPYTGLSIGGYDPVAYFVTGSAIQGVDDYEEIYGDTYWHFATEGNAAAFRAAPAAYIPGFGGYAMAAVARGVAQPGNPTLFAIHRNRLYLFASEDERQAFFADPEAMITAAAARWPEVLKLLAY
ncbi:MAG: hypothetical protein H6Q99_2234 [Proteobacteria bacterium]|nr:hypothetical protein [Pseudomonadota bacterium]